MLKVFLLVVLSYSGPRYEVYNTLKFCQQAKESYEKDDALPGDFSGKLFCAEVNIDAHVQVSVNSNPS